MQESLHLLIISLSLPLPLSLSLHTALHVCIHTQSLVRAPADSLTTSRFYREGDRVKLCYSANKPTPSCVEFTFRDTLSS